MKLLESLIRTIYRLYHLPLFIVFKVQYKTFPRIKGRMFLRNKGTMQLGSGVRINSLYAANAIGGQTFMSIKVRPGATLKIGNNVALSNSAIYCADHISLEDDVFIGGDCKIYDTDFHSVLYNERLAVPEEGKRTAPVCIKKGVLVGTGSIVLKGVTIGEKSVIGAGSVVSKNIPPNEIWGGNPIQFIRKIEQ